MTKSVIQKRPTAATSGSRTVDTWEKRTEWPLALLALAFLGSYAWPILDDNLSHSWRQTCRWVGYLVWLAFLLDFLMRVALAADRAHYISRHLLDVVIIVLPVLRPLRLLRLVMLLRVMNRRATSSLRGKVITYVVGSTALIILCAGLAVLNAERGHAGANIESFGDALWWATVTITTVGYGDRFPVTGEGRFVGVGLMLAGIALLGVVTASIASWLIDRVRDVEEDAAAATRQDIADLRDEIRSLHRLLASQGSTEVVGSEQ